MTQVYEKPGMILVDARADYRANHSFESSLFGTSTHITLKV